MANETPNTHNEFLEFVNGVWTASTVLTESMNKLNQVYLNFCDHLLQTASNTSKEIVAYEKGGAGLKDTLHTATTNVKNDSLVAANKITKEVENTKTVSSSTNNGSYTAPYQELSEQLLDDLKIMTNNFLDAQNELYVTGVAATTMGIARIYSSTNSIESKSNKSALKVANSEK